MRRTAIALGSSLLLGAPLAVVTLACSCGPSTPPPTMETCSDATAPTVTRATPVTTIDRGGGEIADGDPIPSYFGAQGGQHVQLAVRLEGSGFGTCIAQRTELRHASGELLEANDANAQLEVAGGVATTSAILLFPAFIPEGAVLHIEIGGLTIERHLGTVALDAGTEPDAL